MRGVAHALLDTQNDVNILDMEASIEHLGRGTPGGVDRMLVVLEPYYRALETAGRIAPLAAELGVPVVGVANKIRDELDARVIRDYCRAHGIGVLAEIPYDDAVREADRAGRPVLDVTPSAPLVRVVQELARRLTEEPIAA